MCKPRRIDRAFNREGWGACPRLRWTARSPPNVNNHVWADEYCCESERAREDGWATSDRRRAV